MSRTSTCDGGYVRGMAETRIEDLNLAPEQYRDLNRQFFAEDRGPHIFIRHRLRGLLLATSDDPRLADLVTSGISHDTVSMTFPAVESPIGAPGTAELATLDAVVMFHHAAETLLQLFVILEEEPPCPWLAITRLKRRRGGLSKRLKDLRNRWKSPTTRGALTRVFYGQNLRGPSGVEKNWWEDQVQGLRIVVSEALRRFHDEADLYNSAKHGLGMVPGQAAMSYGDLPDPIIKASGPSLTILEVGESSTGPKWFQTTHWINRSTTIAMTALIADQIENLWAVARARYADGPVQWKPKFASGKKIKEALKGEMPEAGYRFDVPQMKMTLLYRTAPVALDQTEGDG